MKKEDWKIMLGLILVAIPILGILLGIRFLGFFNYGDPKKVFQENKVIVRESFGEFAGEIMDFVKKYDKIGFFKEKEKDDGSEEETVIVRETFDEFADEIINLVRKYDKKLDEEAKQDPYASRRLIVQGNENTKLDLAAYGAEVVVQGPDNMYVFQFSDKTKTKEAEILFKEENIEYCELDTYVKAAEDVVEYEPMSWGVVEMGASEYAEEVEEKTSESVTVAVIDTGVYQHTFLKDRVMSHGRDLVDNDYDPDDKNSHGTHVAGTIVDCTPGLNVKILPVRVLDSSGYGSSLIVSLGVRYAVGDGAQVLNLSLGGDISKTLDNAILYAINRGSTVVVSAGNEEKTTYNVSPAHLEECIVVSAIDEYLNKAQFSNWGKSIDFAAPGTNIVSCIPRILWGIRFGETKCSKNGTSMAAPHISGLAAMIKLESPELSPSEVYEKLKSMCTDLGEPGRDEYYGWGMPCYDGRDREEFPDLLETETETKQEEPEQTDVMEGYREILEEYRWLAENQFDYNLMQEVRYANEGVWNFGTGAAYCVYYRLADLAGDGEPELLISVNKEGDPFNIVDIFGMDNGKPVALIESHASVGYRSIYHITTDNRVKNISSGGALNTWISYYTLPEKSVVLEKEAEYAYDGWNGDQCTYTDAAGSTQTISKEEYDAIRSEADVDTQSEWKLLYGPGGEGSPEWEKESEAPAKPRPDQEDHTTSATSIYQGIFMKDDVFLSLALYTSPNLLAAIGEIREVERPRWTEEGYIDVLSKDSVGEIYASKNDGEYEVRGAGSYSLQCFDGEIELTGDSLYAGTYIQVSNCGANMAISDIWLDIPGDSEERGPDTEDGIVMDPPESDEGENNWQYVLPQSDAVELTEEDLQHLTKEELKLARNEIFARHGRMFNSADLQTYFDLTDWYVRVYTPEEFEKIQYDILSDVEWKNIQLISKAEEKYQ